MSKDSTYNSYLKEMEHYDKDNRFMGASDLCNLILTDDNIDANIEIKAIAAYLKQLNDSSTEV